MNIGMNMKFGKKMKIAMIDVAMSDDIIFNNDPKVNNAVGTTNRMHFQTSVQNKAHIFYLNCAHF